MLIKNLPEVLRCHLVDFLSPTDVHGLGEACAVYKQHLGRSLDNSLSLVLKSGSTSFKCSDPLKSFKSMTEMLPPRSVCISGSACVQAITGMIWPDSDLDIYCSADSAPYVRSWLVGLDLQQAFSGCSSIYRAVCEEDEVDPIDRVEHYLNIKEHRHTILKSGIECNCPAASERSFRLTTSNGAGIPYIPYTRISKVKKEAVNIDLIVLKPGRLPQEAINLFDIVICGTSYYGRDGWVIPSPDLSFACQTDLNSTASNDIALKFMSNLHSQSNRCLFDVANDMGLYRRILDNGYTPSRASGLLASAIQQLQPNVFKSDGNLPLPAFPFRFLVAEISLLRLVYDMKCHLLYRAVMELFEQGCDQYSYMRDLYNNVISRLDMSDLHPTLVHLHNTLIGRFVSRINKYKEERGIVINGIPNFANYKQSGVLESVDSLLEMSNGMSIFSRSDYYYAMDEDDDANAMEYDQSVVFDDHDSDDSVGDGQGTSGMARAAAREAREEAIVSSLTETQMVLAGWVHRHHPGFVGINENTAAEAIMARVENQREMEEDELQGL